MMDDESEDFYKEIKLENQLRTSRILVTAMMKELQEKRSCMFKKDCFNDYANLFKEQVSQS